VSGAPAERRNIAGVRLQPGGRTVECDAGGLRLAPGDAVMVDDRRGPLVATVSVPSADRPVRGPLVRVLRRADERDLERHQAQLRREAEALAFARERARARKLPMKFFRAELAPGADRAMFYFSSEQRVDFRELVRDIAARVHTRIELRQVGVRDEAKAVGGIGSCGRELCCTTFLPHFAPVSIRMAKDQSLVLNPAKVSGQCGRLKCCLVYEQATYAEALKHLPRVGKRVETPNGPGRVEDLNVLAGKIRVCFPDRPSEVYGPDDVRPIAPAGPPPREPPEGPEGGGDDEPPLV
jgi:cell fate regulator YaaT (PSP1 superfamily)